MVQPGLPRNSVVTTIYRQHLWPIASTLSVSTRTTEPSIISGPSTHRCSRVRHQNIQRQNVSVDVGFLIFLFKMYLDINIIK